MKKKEKTSLKAMSKEELSKEREELTRVIMDMQLGKKHNETKNTRLIRQYHQKRAVLETLIHIKELRHD